MTGPDRQKDSDPAATSESLTDRAHRQLEEMIVTLRLQPGQILSEQELSAQLDIGRTPIREALQRLAHEGLIVILPRKGILVAETDPWRQLQVLEVRRELERLLSRASAARATPEQRVQFQAIATSMRKAAKRNDDLAFLRDDRAFNLLLPQAAHNVYAARAMRLLNGHSRRFWYMNYKRVGDLPLMAQLHADQASAIAGGDADAAAKASDVLIDYAESFTRATVERDVFSSGVLAKASAKARPV